jgi:hypothetical protein
MNSKAIVLAYNKSYRKKREIFFYEVPRVDGKPIIKLVQEAQSVTDIWRAIQKAGYPKVTRETVYAHLDRLVEEQVLVKLPKGRRYRNPTLYEISKISLVRYLDTLPPPLYEFFSGLGSLRQISYALELEKKAIQVH